MRVFDDFVRTDASHDEGSGSQFEFLNRSAMPLFASARDLIEDWFAEFPEGQPQTDLRARLRSDDRQHRSAFWELYLHATLRRLGFALALLPEDRRNPDFEVISARQRFYLEATMVQDDDRMVAAQKRREDLIASLNRAHHPDFRLHLRIPEEGQELPPRAEVVARVQRWLRSLDWETARARQVAASTDLPRAAFDFGEWRLELAAYAVPAERRGNSSDRMVTGMFGQAVWSDTTARTLIKLREKATRYGQLDSPLVLAVTSDKSGWRGGHVREALFGGEALRFPVGDPDSAFWTTQPNGLWIEGPRWAKTHVPAVIAGFDIHPWSAGQADLQIWHHPAADSSLLVDLPWASHRVDSNTGELRREGRLAAQE